MDKITLRKQKSQPYLENGFLAGLYDYFGDLCNDENYVKPVPLEVNPKTHPPPELQEFDVMMALSKILKTATGPDRLPFCSLTHGQQLGKNLTSNPFQR